MAVTEALATSVAGTATGEWPPASIAETHSATVVMINDRVFKIKKAVDLGFLDWRSVESRRQAVYRELELNRRFAPDVYLGVAEVRDPLTSHPCDWVLVMRRMPAARRLSTLVVAGQEVGPHLRSVARTLAAHHATARHNDWIDEAGGADALLRRWDSNVAALSAMSFLDQDLVGEAGRRAKAYVSGRLPLLEARIAAHHIRDGHGDLLADDIFCLDDGPRILDCLDFDDDLRALDAVDDAACLVMDLERLGDPDRAAQFLGWYREFADDACPQSLVDHYIAYRAIMRAKVRGIAAVQGDAPAAADARQLLELGLDHLRRSAPVLTVLGGLPGTGKSTIAGRLADRLGAVVLSSDRIRKERVGINVEADAAAPWSFGLYTPHQTDQTYAEILRRAQSLLASGESVILDASWCDAQHRADARAVGHAAGAVVVELRCVLDPAQSRRRLAERTVTGGSDATPDVVDAMEHAFAPWLQAHELDTGSHLSTTVTTAYSLVLDDRHSFGTDGTFGHHTR